MTATLHDRAPLRAGLLIRTGQDGLWLGPIWAVLCGAVAGGGLSWQGVDVLRLVLVMLLVEGGWATLWAAACEVAWLPALTTWRTWQGGRALPLLPYSQPAAPATRAAHWLGHFRDWSRQQLWPDHGYALASLALGAVVALLAAIALGPRLLLLSLVAVAVVQLAFLFSGGGSEASRGAQALVQLGLPWLAGALAFDGSGLLATLLALIFSAAYAGLLHLVRADQLPVPERGPHAMIGTLLVVLAPLTAALLLAVTFHQLPAFAVGLSAFPCAVLLPWRGHRLSGLQIARVVQWPWMLAMLIAAAAVA